MTAAGRVLDRRDLPREVRGRRPTVLSGMLLFVVIESAVIASLLTSYYYLRVMTPESWPPPGVSPPDLARPAISLSILVASLLPILWARSLHRRRHPMGFHAAVLLGVALLAAYLGVTFYELYDLPYDWRFHVYGSLVWTLTGYQVLHVIGLTGLGLGVLVLAPPVTPTGAWQGIRRLPRAAAMGVLLLYWSFVVVVAIPSYFTIYLAPHLF